MNDIEENINSNIDDYIKSRLDNGDILEDIIDDLEKIVKNNTNKWFDKYPV